jgi:chromate transporter
VGVVLNLAVWFALHVLFAELRPIQGWGISLEVPIFSGVNLPALVLTLVAMVAAFRFRIGMIPVLAACSSAGVLLHLVASVMG